MKFMDAVKAAQPGDQIGIEHNHYFDVLIDVEDARTKGGEPVLMFNRHTQDPVTAHWFSDSEDRWAISRATRKVFR